MQFSENWLRSVVNVDLDSDALSHALTMAGLEVEEMIPVAVPFNHVVVGKILSAEKHPDADRLQVCKVDVGQDELLQIVCGATNARVGLLAPCAMVGAKLPDFEIKKAKVRGVESFGMMCSAKELGIATEADGLLELENDAIAGQSIREYLDLDDHLFTLKLTPNRSDCLSIQGIAREVKAITGASIIYNQIKAVAATVEQSKIVKISDSVACPRYCGRIVTGINSNVPTPAWMIKRLERSGIRSISAVVDITNYVLLALGQPMHAFDADKLSGDICVRYANQDESLTLLNGNTVNLQADDLVITDTNNALALAGVMGGLPSSVNDETNTIFLESAFFPPTVIAGKARRLGLSTDSSYRFERGVDFANTRKALEYATQLILDICGGHAGDVTEVIGTLPVREPVRLRLSRLNSILGIDFDPTTVATFLDQLQFDYQVVDGIFTVTPPSYRFDIKIEEDLIEEVARLHGYEHVPAIAPIACQSMLPLAESKKHIFKIKEALVSLGYQEIVNYSFVDAHWEADLLGNPDPIKLVNPIASQFSVMRSSLWGGLIDTLIYNLNRQQERAFLFEVGAIYQKQAQAFKETSKISGLIYGSVKPEQWSVSSKEVDFFDLKAHLQSLVGEGVLYEKAIHTALHPGQSAKIIKNGQVIGWLGKLHPKWQQHYQISKSAYLFEVDLLEALNIDKPRYVEVSKQLPIRRDIAIVVDDQIALQSIISTVNDARIPLLYDIKLFDFYQGKSIGQNKKSLALSVLIHDTQRTLTDVDADNTISNLLQLLNVKFDAVLRN
jgi:phenylalanyl-tRNA synthetase beta chain